MMLNIDKDISFRVEMITILTKTISELYTSDFFI